MQILLIFGIGIAIVAVLFAMQNNTPVAVSFLTWGFDGSLALVLLIALGLGALIAGLITTPTVIRNQWANGRLRRQISQLEAENKELLQRLTASIAELSDPAPDNTPVIPDKPYVGLKALLTNPPQDVPKP